MTLPATPQRLRRRRAARRGAEAGLSLVELLVASAISLLTVLAATSVYLATRDTQRTIDEANAAHESGAYALRQIGRELMNAAFYPAVRIENAALANVMSEYTNITGRAAYDVGLFGCEGGVFDLTAGTCPTPVAGQPDSLVVGYFTSDAFGTAVGQRADCQGNDVGAATAQFNVGRLGPGAAGVPPLLPLFVANHYTLVGGANNRAGVNEAVTVDGRTVNTFSLGCSGNGSNVFSWTPLVSGLEDLQLSYGVFTDNTRQPRQYFNADAIAALGTITIDGVPMAGWQRVSSVRVCVVARSFQTPAAIGSQAGQLRQFQDCNGNNVDQPLTDRSLRKTYVQVFGVRNRQNATY
jgi:type IV pilus assembly protein PilW